MSKDLRKEFNRLRKNVLPEKCGTACVCCGHMESIEYHHILPLAIGGDNRISNIVPVCSFCHGKIHSDGAMVRLTKYSSNTGRPKNTPVPEYKRFIRKYITGEIDMYQLHELLQLKPKAKATDQWYYKEYLKELGIKSIIRKASKAQYVTIDIYFLDGHEERFERRKKWK